MRGSPVLGKKSSFVVFTGLLCLLSLLHMFRFAIILDDAFVSFRAALHWTQSGIPVYNPGSMEWVPTNFLWVAVLALLHKVLALNIPLLAQIAGGLAGVAVLAALTLLGGKIFSRIEGVAAALLCAGSSLWAAWPLSGMETTFFSCLLTCGILLGLLYLEERQSWPLVWAAVCFGLAGLTRPDGVVVFLCFSLGLVLLKARWKALATYGLIYLLILSAGALYLQLTFGQVLPASYFAKVQGLSNAGAGRDYIKSFFKTYHLAYFLIFLMVPVWKGAYQKYLLLMLSVLAGWVGYVWLVGGDFMPYHRFLAPLWPILCLCFTLGLVRTMVWLREERPGWQGLFRWSALALFLLLGFYFMRPTFVGHDLAVLRSWEPEEHDRALIGQWFAGHYPAKTGIALKPAGRIPFYSKFAAMDFYCITSRAAGQSAQQYKQNWIGHQAVNLDWVLEQHPDIVLLDEHLYAKERLPQPDAGDGIIEQKWRAAVPGQRYRLRREEIEAGRWLQYYEKSE